MAVFRCYLLSGLIFIYAEGLYIAQNDEVAPLYVVQAYEGPDNFGSAQLTRINADYKRSARALPDQTVIVMPNQGTRQPYGYGTYGTSANRGPTVIVSNVPDQYNGVITDPYRRY